MRDSTTPTVGLVVLGCDKNTVDSEYLAASLARRGALVTADPIGDGPVDAVIIATCGFTDEARAQSVETMRKWADYKRRSAHPMRLYVWSCMSQRWADDLLDAIPEIDGIAGVGHFEQLAEAILDGWTERDANKVLPPHAIPSPPTVRITPDLARLRLDRRPHAFLKIADGCNHRCAFCAIPLMKGRLRSVPRGILLDEARALIDSGAREIVLIAQDTGDYGRDLYRRYRLPDLLEDLLRIEGDFWVRLLYLYPRGLNERLGALLAGHPKMCPYIDMPLQHLDVEALRRMRRPWPCLNVARLVERLRERIPDLAVRTTMMVGFPGEDRRAFQRLLDGVRQIRFDRLGAFTFSAEQHTPAAAMNNRPSRRTALRRLDRLMRLQAGIAADLSASQIGRTVRVLVDAVERDGKNVTAEPKKIIYVGRTKRDAPDVDGVVRFRSDRPLEIGSFVEVRITAAETHDLIGECLPS